MKRIVTLMIVFMLAMGLCVPAFAYPGGFVSSPSLNDEPELMAFSLDPEDGNVQLIVTPYSRRDTLNDEMKQNFEAAYSSIFENADLSKLVPGIAEFTGVDAANLAVSDLFHVHVEYMVARAVAEDVTTYTLTVDCRTLNKFEALLQKTESGWVIVENARLTDEGYVQFDTQELGVFAVVVDIENGGVTPPTGDMLPLFFAGLLLTAAAFVAVMLFKGRKAA